MVVLICSFDQSKSLFSCSWLGQPLAFIIIIQLVKKVILFCANSQCSHFQQRNRPKPNYMRKQPDITSSMRSILVDWLVEVAEEYKLHRETLCLSVNYIDRFLSQMSVLRGKLQLVGAACMFVAS